MGERAHELPVGAVVAGRYRIDSLLGSGGFGAVYAATSLVDTARVALKVLDAGALDAVGGRARVRREAELARRLDHPNVVRVLDEGTAVDGTLFIAFELLEGRSLDDELARWGAMQQRRAAGIALQVLDALEAAHAAGIVHRDLKPANIFLALGSDHIKVLDFGIAKSTQPGTIAGLTAAGVMLGTPAYMADEQITGGALGPYSDLYALGVVLLDMLTGMPPYPVVLTPMEIVQDKLRGRGVPVPDEVRRLALGAVVIKATMPKPADRFTSAREMRLAIEAVLADPAFTDSVVMTTGLRRDVSMSHSDVMAVTGASDPRGAPPMAVAPTAVPAQSQAVGAPSVGYRAAAPPWGVPYAPPQGGIWSPAAAAPPPGYVYGAPYPTPTASRTPWVAIGVVGALLMLVVFGGAGWALMSRARGARPDTDAPSGGRRGETERGAEPAARDGDVPGGAVRPPDEPVAASRRVRACPKVAGVGKAALRVHLNAIGWRETGVMLYCPGDMVNFRCVTADSDGMTASSPDGRTGSLAILKFRSDSGAQEYAKNETEAVTLATAGRAVLRVELPEADADRLMERICR